jgi:hypothetical protein
MRERAVLASEGLVGRSTAHHVGELWGEAYAVGHCVQSCVGIRLGVVLRGNARRSNGRKGTGPCVAAVRWIE